MSLIHRAGPFNKQTLLQYCSRCGMLLAHQRAEGVDDPPPTTGRFVPFTQYPDGALVECGPGYSAMVLGEERGDTCTDV